MIVKRCNPKKLQRCNYIEVRKNANYNNVSMFAGRENNFKNANKCGRV